MNCFLRGPLRIQTKGFRLCRFLMMRMHCGRWRNERRRLSGRTMDTLGFIVDNLSEAVRWITRSWRKQCETDNVYDKEEDESTTFIGFAEIRARK